MTGKACALGGKLQAGRETGNVPCAQIDHPLAEMSQYHAGAGADDETHARDHGEGCEQACPDAPLQPQESRAPTKFTNRQSRRHVAPAQAIRLNRERQYRVTRFTKSGALAGLAGLLRIKTKKAGAKAGLFRVVIGAISTRRRQAGPS